ncbi:hypothetical protein AAKU55_003307 [Oxalobacteraceae bacterium GrIS 1.11]
MKTSHSLLAIPALALTLCAHAAPPPVLTQGFDDVAALGGWLFINQSSPAGQSWFQGNSGIFPAYAGAGDSYIGANFLSVQNGVGTLDNWLITPELTLSGPTQLTFYTRSAATPGYRDTLEVRFGTGSDTASFSQTLLTLGGALPYPGAWQRQSATVAGGGHGRFAFRYTGMGQAADYIGIDSVVVASVPEPAGYALLGAGLSLLALLALLRRRPRHAASAAATLTALAALSLAPAASAAEQAMVVVRDAASGQLRAPTATEFKALQALDTQRKASQKSSAPQLNRKADGTRQAHLGDQAMVYSVISRDPDGRTHERCVSGAAAADAAIATPTHTEEHGHEID